MRHCQRGPRLLGPAVTFPRNCSFHRARQLLCCSPRSSSCCCPTSSSGSLGVLLSLLCRILKAFSALPAALWGGGGSKCAPGCGGMELGLLRDAEGSLLHAQERFTPKSASVEFPGVINGVHTCRGAVPVVGVGNNFKHHSFPSSALGCVASLLGDKCTESSCGSALTACFSPDSRSALSHESPSTKKPHHHLHLCFCWQHESCPALGHSSWMCAAADKDS